MVSQPKDFISSLQFTASDPAARGDPRRGAAGSGGVLGPVKDKTLEPELRQTGGPLLKLVVYSFSAGPT